MCKQIIFSWAYDLIEVTLFSILPILTYLISQYSYEMSTTIIPYFQIECGWKRLNNLVKMTHPCLPKTQSEILYQGWIL